MTQIEIEELKEDVCENYCKWAEVYRSWYDDPDEAHEHMMNDKCDSCPLDRL